MSKHNRERRRLRALKKKGVKLTPLELIRIHKHGKRKLAGNKGAA